MLALTGALEAARTEPFGYWRLLEPDRTPTVRPLVRVVGSVEINRPADQVWAYVADYGNDTSWRAGLRQMHPSRPGSAQVGVTTHETLRLLRLTFAPTPASTGSRPAACSPGMPTIGRSSCEELGWWS
jgi:hypothetical protein